MMMRVIGVQTEKLAEMEMLSPTFPMILKQQLFVVYTISGTGVMSIQLTLLNSIGVTTIKNTSR